MNGSSGSSPLNQMKQWLDSKLHLLTQNDTDITSVIQDYSAPEIIVSSDTATAQAICKFPNTLPISQENSDKAHVISQGTRPLHNDRSFQAYNSQRTKGTSISKLLPRTPVNLCPMQISNSDGNMFTYGKDFNKGAYHASLQFYSQQNLNNLPLCSACGQNKPYSDFDNAEITTYLQREKEHRHLAENNSVTGFDENRRSKYTMMSSKSDSQVFRRSARMIKAASTTEVQTLRTPKGKPKVGSTKSNGRDSKSMNSLTRSWSINIGKLRIVRSDSMRSKDDVDHMSSSGHDLLRECNRGARSYYNDSDRSLAVDGGVSIPDSDYTDDNAAYSLVPQGAPRLMNGQSASDFKYEFDSESIRIPSIYGQIKIMFQFFNDTGQFLVSILKGSSIARRKKGTLGLYTKACLVPGKHQMKRGMDKHDTHDPVFYEHFSFHLSLGELLDRQLRIKLYNKPGVFSIPEPVGECTVPLFYYDLTAVTVIWQNLKKSKGQEDDLEEVGFSQLERDQKGRRGVRSFLCGL